MKLKNKINQERDKKLEIKRIMFKLDKKTSQNTMPVNEIKKQNQLQKILKAKTKQQKKIKSQN